jgi:hypothetical protein
LSSLNKIEVFKQFIKSPAVYGGAFFYARQKEEQRMDSLSPHFS